MVVDQRFDSVGVHCHALSVAYIIMTIHAPSVSYSYHVNDGQVFWSIHDDSINVHDYEDNMISITGVKAKPAFQMARNMMCAKQNVFDELDNPKPYEIEMAKEMKTALEYWIAQHESKDAKKTMEG